MIPASYQRTASRAERWESESQRNTDIKRRVASGQAVEQVATYYGLSVNFVERISGAMRALKVETAPIAHFCPNCGFNQSPDPAVTIAGWTVDPATRHVDFDGKRAHLTPAEFTIFHTLIAANGALVSRDALMERIGSDSDTNSLQVIVGRLRGKVEKTPIEILTVRGAGFRLVRANGADLG